MYHTDYSRIQHYKERMEITGDVSDEEFEGFSNLKKEYKAKKNKKQKEGLFGVWINRIFK